MAALTDLMQLPVKDQYRNDCRLIANRLAGITVRPGRPGMFALMQQALNQSLTVRSRGNTDGLERSICN